MSEDDLTWRARGQGRKPGASSYAHNHLSISHDVASVVYLALSHGATTSAPAS
jgi:hypothetical protein